MNFHPGMLVKSKQGRDKDQVYVIIEQDPRYVHVADGWKWTVCHTKKKNRKHLQPIKKVVCLKVEDDEEVKKSCLAVKDQVCRRI